jgi:hypothetical protein
MKIVNIEVKLTYTFPALIKNETELNKVFNSNKKAIIQGFGDMEVIQIIDDKINWVEDTQVFTKDGIYLEIEEAKRIAASS